MRLKRVYKDLIFDIIKSSEFDINEFEIDNPDGGEHITIIYIFNEIRITFAFVCVDDAEYFVSYNTPIKLKNKVLPLRTKITIDYEKWIKISLSKLLTRWLKEINEEIRTPDKFTQYFDNLKLNSIPESKGKQPPNSAESKILNQQLDDIRKIISNNKNILLNAQEVLFDELEEIKEIIEQKQFSLRMIYNTIIGTIGKWCVNFAISSEVIKHLVELVMGGIKKMLGE